MFVVSYRSIVSLSSYMRQNWSLGADHKYIHLEKPCPELRSIVSGRAGLQYDRVSGWLWWRHSCSCLQTGWWGYTGPGLYNGDVNKVPLWHHHSLCSIFTFGGLRKVLFFFSLLFFPLAWKFLQLSTRPSLVSWQMVYRKERHLKNAESISSHRVSAYKSVATVMTERTSKFFCHSLSRFAFSATSISSSLALFLKRWI